MAVMTTLSKDGKTLTIGISNRFDITTYKNFTQAFKDKQSHSAENLRLLSRVVVDLSEVNSVDAAALGMLVMLREEATANMIDLIISNCGSDVKEIFTACGLEKVFKVDRP
ncbi:MAG: STAS domain-containing protein [Deltaproteobacteria bacterium]|nr:STAS domain-containing protein [Deltaproteobacteria bacterium]